MGWIYSMRGEGEKCIHMLDWKSSRKNPFRRLRHRRENNITMYVKEIN